jgi:hypothetical protein
MIDETDCHTLNQWQATKQVTTFFVVTVEPLDFLSSQILVVQKTRVGHDTVRCMESILVPNCNDPNAISPEKCAGGRVARNEVFGDWSMDEGHARGVRRALRIFAPACALPPRVGFAPLRLSLQGCQGGGRRLTAQLRNLTKTRGKNEGPCFGRPAKINRSILASRQNLAGKNDGQ